MFLGRAVAKVPATEILIPVGDWNGHVSATPGVYCDGHVSTALVPIRWKVREFQNLP